MTLAVEVDEAYSFTGVRLFGVAAHSLEAPYLADLVQKGVSMATPEENKAQFRRTYDELFNQGNLAVAEEVVASDFINHEVPPGFPNRGPEAMVQVVMMLRGAFPDLHFTVEELVAEGDMVAGRVTMRGTHQGLFMGIAPTGRAVQQAHMHFVRFSDGKAVEQRAVRDDLTLMRQLNVVSGPPPAG